MGKDKSRKEVKDVRTWPIVRSVSDMVTHTEGWNDFGAIKSTVSIFGKYNLLVLYRK